MKAYVGCRTTKERGAKGEGLRCFDIMEDGGWLLRQTLPGFPNPSYLCLDQEKRYLYSVHGDYSEISAYALTQTGEMKYLNTVSTCGVNPVHLTIDRSNRFVYVANLQSGNISVIARQSDGSLGQLVQYVALPGRTVATSSHPHQVMQDERGEYLLVSAQGRLQGKGGISVFAIDADGRLSASDIVASREKAEPRHCVFHPNNRFCYGVNEKDCTVTFYHFEGGRLIPKQIVSTLRDTYVGEGWASGIIIDPQGRFLYVSDRKQDSISCLQIDQTTGTLSFVDDISTQGKQPRFLCLDHQSQGIVAANELSDTIRFFDRDPATGRMTDTGRKVDTETPVCVVYR